MPRPDDLGDLNSDEWRELQECASRLEKTLFSAGRAADLLRYLPPPGQPHRRSVLIELVKVELEALYRKKRGLPLETYLKRYPELGAADELPPALLYEEYRVRRLFGDHPTLELYRERFPRQFEQLRMLVNANPLPTANQTTPLPGDAQPVQPRTVRAEDNGAENTPATPPLGNDEEESVSRLLREAQRQGTNEFGGLVDLTGYRKLERLGRGEFGEVWNALAPGGVEVALKFILRTLDHEATRRELKSLEKIRKLHHPYLLQTHSYGMFENKLAIVMELAEGSLSDRFKECKDQKMEGIPVEELVTYFGQASEALDYLHSQHVAHRDIKPQNLLMLSGYAKVADFGLAREQEQSVDAASVVCGTPYYMAPEIWQQQISRHSDQYSLAATYVEMRLGRRVFSGKNPFEIAEQHLRAVPDLKPLPPKEQAALKRALAKDPDKRFPTCAAFAEALKEAIAPPKPRPQASGKSVKALIVGLGAALTAALVIVSVMLSRPSPTTGDNSDQTKLDPTKILVDWQPAGWEPDGNDIIKDRNERRYYKRLVRKVAGEKVILVAIPMTRTSDPKTFYIMENKVWNDLFAAFMRDPHAEGLLKEFGNPPGGEGKLLRDEWSKGGSRIVMVTPEKDKLVDTGVLGQWQRAPVFRVTVTEAHSFAEWFGGRIPKLQQWRKAAGLGEDNKRLGPFDGEVENPAVLKEIAVILRDGPWPVDKGMRDISMYGCRQMASNGKEWTRDTTNPIGEIPLMNITFLPSVYVVGQSYQLGKPLIFEVMKAEPNVASCKDAKDDIGFRVVIEQP